MVQELFAPIDFVKMYARRLFILHRTFEAAELKFYVLRGKKYLNCCQHFFEKLLNLHDINFR